MASATILTIIGLLLLDVVSFIHGKYWHFQPEQIHLAIGHNNSEIVVTWSTFDDTEESVVEYGIGALVLQAKGYSSPFVDGGSEKRTQYIHRVVLQNLLPQSKYMYHCGSKLGWSDQFWFTTFPSGDNWQPHLVIYGDLGNENAQSLPRLQRETQRNMYDAILHVGDFAYDMYEENGTVGDEFMKQIEACAAYVPYMTSPGNHEQMYNFSHYRSRFSMPGDTESLYYSYNLGPLHIISISTEVYYFLQYGIKLLTNQYSWLVDDLIKANLPQNREKQPWIIVLGHRPMYCSNWNGDDCTKRNTYTRVGVPSLNNFFGLEELLYNYGVDLEIWAHEHSYERLWPIYNYTVCNGSYTSPYVNPKSPVHLITGSAGNREGRENFTVYRPSWSAFYSRDYGYTRLKAYNRSHIHIEQVSDDKDGAVIDSFWIVKEVHGLYENSKIDWASFEKLRFETLTSNISQ